jgi:hypothetical protein
MAQLPDYREEFENVTPEERIMLSIFNPEYKEYRAATWLYFVGTAAKQLSTVMEMENPQPVLVASLVASLHERCVEYLDYSGRSDLLHKFF